jgi:hypothetical protein
MYLLMFLFARPLARPTTSHPTLVLPTIVLRTTTSTIPFQTLFSTLTALLWVRLPSAFALRTGRHACQQLDPPLRAIRSP